MTEEEPVLWSVTYTDSVGDEYCMRLHATRKEMESHTRNLNLSLDGLIIHSEVINDSESQIMNKIFKSS